MAITKHSSVIFLSLTTILTFLFCAAIGFDITPLLRGPAPYPPEWQWAYQFTNTLGRFWAPGVVGLLGLLGLFYFDDNKRQQEKFFSVKFLLFIIVFLLLLQAGILYFSRAGFGVLLGRIINPGITGYFTTALSVQSIGSFLSTYQQRVSHFSMRSADHPPFAVLFFSLILFVSHHLQFLFPFVAKISLHHSDIASLWSPLQPFQKLAALLNTMLIPMLSTGVLLPLYFFTKLYYDKNTAVRACFLYSIFPAVLLFLPLNDTFLGLFGIVGFLGVLLGQRKKSILYYFLGGLSIAIGAFFSASMLVVILMAILFLALSTCPLKEKILGGLGVLGGLVILPILLLVFYHFNTFGVFLEITRLQAKRSYLPWTFYDLYDFFIFAGIPVLVCSIVIIKNILKRLLPFGFTQGKLVHNDALTIAFFLTLFLLDISGFSRAEAGRIWMPYMPFLAVIAAAFLTKEKKFSTTAFSALLVMQLVQLLVMQEFWVTLW